MKIPLKTEQEIDCLDICYIDSSNKIVFIDSNEVLHPKVQRAPDRFGPLCYALIEGVILYYEIRYWNWDAESTYYPKQTETPLISCPYYEQPGPTCWAAAHLMLLKAYNPNADLNIYNLDYLVMSNSVTSGLDFSVTTSAEINKLKEIYKKYVTIDTKDDWNLVEPISKLHPYKLFNRVLSALDNNKPSIGYINDHAYVFLGYINKSSYEEIELIFHDPIFYCTDLPYHKMKIKDLRNRFKGAGSGFSSIPSANINNSILQTINLWSNENISKYNEFEGLGFFKNGFTVDYVSYDRTKNDGYTFQNSEIPNFDQITIKVKCFNTSAKPVDCLIKTEIFKLNEKLEKINEPIIPKSSDSQSVPPIIPSETNLNLDMKTLYKPFTIDIPRNSFTDNINENDANFEICTSLYNINNPTQKLDGFNIKFKYRKLFIKPSNGLKNPLPLDSPITFIASAGSETISNDKINWSIDPADNGATMIAGIFAATQNAIGKSFTIKGIVNDPQSIHNGKEAIFEVNNFMQSPKILSIIAPKKYLEFGSASPLQAILDNGQTQTNVTNLVEWKINYGNPIKINENQYQFIANQIGNNIVMIKLLKDTKLPSNDILVEDIEAKIDLTVFAIYADSYTLYAENEKELMTSVNGISLNDFEWSINNKTEYSGQIINKEGKYFYIPSPNTKIYYDCNTEDIITVRSKSLPSVCKEIKITILRPLKKVVKTINNMYEFECVYIGTLSGTEQILFYHGYYKMWYYSTDKIKIEGNYDKGHKTGVWKGTYSSGLPCYEGQYVNDLKVEHTWKRGGPGKLDRGLKWKNFVV